MRLKTDDERRRTGAIGWGDRSRTWRWPGTGAVDRVSSAGSRRLAKLSPLVGRLLVDGSYLRAALGTVSLVVPVLGIALGVAAAGATGSNVLPTSLVLFAALPVLGVFDAVAGLAGALVFGVATVVGGDVAGLDAARLLVGLVGLSVAAPLVAGATRPLRRPRPASTQERWDRGADLVIGSLVGAWVTQQIAVALPGLVGVDADAGRADAVGLAVLAAMVLRMLAERATMRRYPQRLGTVRPEPFEKPSRVQRAGAVVVRTAVVLLVAEAYLGASWHLYAGGLLFALPHVIGLLGDRLPSSPKLYRRLPRGMVRLVLLIVVGVGLASVFFHGRLDDRFTIRTAFVVLAIPGALLSCLDLFGRDGQRRTLGWADRLVGTAILAVGVLVTVSRF